MVAVAIAGAVEMDQSFSDTGQAPERHASGVKGDIVANADVAHLFGFIDEDVFEDGQAFAEAGEVVKRSYGSFVHGSCMVAWVWAEGTSLRGAWRRLRELELEEG